MAISNLFLIVRTSCKSTVLDFAKSEFHWIDFVIIIAFFGKISVLLIAVVDVILFFCAVWDICTGFLCESVG